MSEDRDNGGMIRLGGLWQNKTKKTGEMFLSGTFSPGVAMFVFKNKNKKEDKHPDYVLCIAQKEPKEKKPDDAAGDGGGGFIG